MALAMLAPTRDPVKVPGPLTNTMAATSSSVHRAFASTWSTAATTVLDAVANVSEVCARTSLPRARPTTPETVAVLMRRNACLDTEAPRNDGRLIEIAQNYASGLFVQNFEVDLNTFVHLEECSGPLSPLDYRHTMLFQFFLETHFDQLSRIFDAIEIKMPYRFFAQVVSFQDESGTGDACPIDAERLRERAGKNRLTSAQRTDESNNQ